MSEETSFNVLTSDQLGVIPQPVPAAGPQVQSPILVTSGVPISDSGGQQQRVFLPTSPIFLGPIDTSRFRVILSSLPDTNAPIIVDDSIIINGRQQPGYAGVTADPRRFLGQSPEVCYKSIDPVDISRDLRMDGFVYISGLDVGGACVLFLAYIYSYRIERLT